MLKAESYLTVLYLWTYTFRSACRHVLTHARKQASALRAPLWKTNGPDSKGFHFMVVSIYDTHKQQQGFSGGAVV